MKGDNKKILTAIVLVILLAITGYIYYQNRFPSGAPVYKQSNTVKISGPQTAPYVNGPTDIPPGE